MAYTAILYLLNRKKCTSTQWKYMWVLLWHTPRHDRYGYRRHCGNFFRRLPVLVPTLSYIHRLSDQRIPREGTLPWYDHHLCRLDIATSRCQHSSSHRQAQAKGGSRHRCGSRRNSKSILCYTRHWIDLISEGKAWLDTTWDNERDLRSDMCAKWHASNLCGWEQQLMTRGPARMHEKLCGVEIRYIEPTLKCSKGHTRTRYMFHTYDGML